MPGNGFEILILGGGLAGLSFACALRDTRLRVALVEQRMPGCPAGWDARVYAVSPANARFLNEIGAWKHMATERIAPILSRGRQHTLPLLSQRRMKPETMSQIGRWRRGTKI